METCIADFCRANKTVETFKNKMRKRGREMRDELKNDGDCLLESMDHSETRCVQADSETFVRVVHGKRSPLPVKEVDIHLILKEVGECLCSSTCDQKIELKTSLKNVLSERLALRDTRPPLPPKVQITSAPIRGEKATPLRSIEENMRDAVLSFVQKRKLFMSESADMKGSLSEERRKAEQTKETLLPAITSPVIVRMKNADGSEEGLKIMKSEVRQHIKKIESIPRRDFIALCIKTAECVSPILNECEFIREVQTSVRDHISRLEAAKHTTSIQVNETIRVRKLPNKKG